jgi:hypothetical protein
MRQARMSPVIEECARAMVSFPTSGKPTRDTIKPASALICEKAGRVVKVSPPGKLIASHPELARRGPRRNRLLADVRGLCARGSRIRRAGQPARRLVRAVPPARFCITRAAATPRPRWAPLLRSLPNGGSRSGQTARKFDPLPLTRSRTWSYRALQDCHRNLSQEKYSVRANFRWRDGLGAFTNRSC